MKLNDLRISCSSIKVRKHEKYYLIKINKLPISKQKRKTGVVA